MSDEHPVGKMIDKALARSPFGTGPSDMEILMMDIRRLARDKVKAIVDEEAAFAAHRVTERIKNMMPDLHSAATAMYDRAGMTMHVEFNFKIKDNING